jgi:hypothetical protein
MGAVLIPVASSRAGKPLAPVPLIVTVETADSEGSLCRILGDGRGAYVDGSQGVSASLNKSGFLVINTQTAPYTPPRGVRYDFSMPVPPNTVIPPVDATAVLNLYLYTHTGVIQDVPVGGTLCTSASVLFATDVNWTLRYSGASQFQTADLHVTHPDADTWIVEPLYCSASSAMETIAQLSFQPSGRRNPPPPTIVGNYYVPFAMVLKRK